MFSQNSVFSSTKEANNSFYIIVRNLDPDKTDQDLKETMRFAFSSPSLDVTIKRDPKALFLQKIAILAYSDKHAFEIALRDRPLFINNRPVDVIRGDSTELLENSPPREDGSGLPGDLNSTANRDLIGNNKSEGGGLFGGSNTERVINKNEEDKSPEKDKIGSNSTKDAAQLVLDELLASKRFADVTFEVQGENILAHKLVLRERCKYFGEILENVSQQGSMAKINVPDVNPSVFKAFLEYLYCDTVQQNQEIAVQLLQLAKKYDVPELKSKCEDVLGSLLSIANFVWLTKAIEEFDIPELRETLLDFSKENIVTLAKQEDLEDIPNAFLVDMIVHAASSDPTELALKKLLHYSVNKPENQKMREITEIMDNFEFDQIVIFVSSSKRAVTLNQYLNECAFPSVPIHIEMSIDERNKVLKEFKEFSKRILVCMDHYVITAEIPKVNIVVNYDMPEPLTPEQDEITAYVRRVKTFSAKGLAISFVASEQDKKTLKKIEDKYNLKISELPKRIDGSKYMER